MQPKKNTCLKINCNLQCKTNKNEHKTREQAERRKQDANEKPNAKQHETTQKNMRQKQNKQRK